MPYACENEFHVRCLNNMTRPLYLFNLLIPILIISSAVHGQDISNKYPDLIKRVDQINQDRTLTMVTLKNEEFLTQVTDGGGDLIGYFKKEQVQKIRREITFSYGTEIYDYYFTDGKLIFVYETLDGFIYVESSGKFDYTKTERNFIGRYYFKDGNLIDSESDTIALRTTPSTWKIH